jgi:hypothetical protein
LSFPRRRESSGKVLPKAGISACLLALNQDGSALRWSRLSGNDRTRNDKMSKYHNSKNEVKIVFLKTQLYIMCHLGHQKIFHGVPNGEFTLKLTVTFCRVLFGQNSGIL